MAALDRRSLRRTVDTRVAFALAFLACAGIARAGWSPPSLLGRTPDSALPLDSRPLEVAVSGSTIHVVWFARQGERLQLRYRRSEDCGASWSAPQTLGRIDKPNTFGYTWAKLGLAVTGERLHVVWLHKRGNDRNYRLRVLHRASHDGGETWRRRQRVSRGEVDGSPPSIALDGDKLFVTWSSYGTFFVAASADAGDSWRSLDTPWQGDTQGPFVVAAGRRAEGESRLQVFGYTDHTRDLLQWTSNDSGATWLPRTKIFRARRWVKDSGYALPRAAVVYGGVLHLLWTDFEYYKYGYIDAFPYYAARDETLWSQKARLGAPESGVARSLAVHDGEVYVAWDDWRRDSVIVSRARAGPDRLIKRFPTRRWAFPSLAGAAPVVCRETLHLVYRDRVAGRPGIVYQRRTSR